MAYQNFFTTKLFTDIGAADTTITLETPPTALSGRLVLEARNATKREIIKYTGVAGNQITGVTRGQGGTTATTHTKNALVEMNLTSQDIQDLYDAFATFAAATGSWLTAVMTITSIVNNGNRSYDINTSTDMTSIISPGMRLRTTRTVAAPTQSTSLNGTTQYYSKATPSAMTFTDDFVVSAWVKLSSYAEGIICGRWDGTNGWMFEVNPSGQIVLNGYSGAAINYSRVTSYQSIPLNKWVHVAAQLDMSTFTATTTTSYVMIDGVDVPASVLRAGTLPTALVQGTGAFEIGRLGAIGLYFPGKIAQFAVYNAKVTQATIRASMNQTLSGSETSLISAYSFNNTINDLSANANNLTANGSAVATNADSPFGGQAGGTISSTLDYGIVQKVTSSVITVQVPEGCTIPTSGGVSAVSYSTFKAPYGFPSEEDKWTLSLLFFSQLAHTNPASATTVQNVLNGMPVYFPAGKWIPGGSVTMYMYKSSAGTQSAYAGWSTTNASVTNPVGSVGIYNNLAIAGDSVSQVPPNPVTTLNLSTMTAYYFYIYGINGMTALAVYGQWIGNNTPAAVWTFKNAYL